MPAASQPAQSVANRPYLYGLSGAAALSGLLFGFDTAVINGALIFLKEQLRLTEVQTEAAASALLVGCLFGSAIAGHLTDRFGRRKLLLQAALLFCISSIWTALPRSLAEFAAGRFTAGLAIGVASVLAPMYIAEIAPPAIRGRMVTLNQMAIVTGIVLSYFVNWVLAGLGPTSWRWMFGAAAIPSAAFFIALLFIPESPRWLMRWKRDDEARRILTRVAGAAAADEQARQIRESLAEESGSYRELFSAQMRRPLAIAVLLAVFSQVTGINTVIYYGALLLKEHGGRGGAAEAIGANVLVGIVNFLATILAIALIDRLGRKPLLLIGSAGMGTLLVALAFCLRLNPVPANLVLALILGYVAFFAISLGPGTWVCISELFPTAIRGRAQSIATLSLWAACTLITMTFLTLVKALGAGGAFLVYAVLCAVTFLFVLKLVPETKGRTLEEISRTWMRR